MVGKKITEEACVKIFREARRTAPSIIYVPHMDVWWDTVSPTIRTAFAQLLQDLESSKEVLLLATCETPAPPAAISYMFPTTFQVDFPRREYSLTVFF